MSSGTTAKVRLVRCPKCRRILPEMPNIPVYQCGGCFTTLQAKSQRQTVSSIPETKAEESNNLDHVSEDKASSSSNHEATLHCAVDQNSGLDQAESGNVSNIDDLRGKNALSENESNMSDQNGSEGSFGGDKLECNPSYDIQKSESNNNEAGACDDAQLRCANLSNDNHKSDSHQCDFLTSNEDCSSKEPAFLENGELLSASARALLRAKDNDETSSLAFKVKTGAEIDANNDIGSIHKRSNKGELVDTMGSCSVITTCSPAGASLSSDVSVSSPDELLEQPHEPSHHGLDRLRSTESFYSSTNEQLEQARETAVRGFDRLRSTDLVYASPNEQLEQLHESTVCGLDRLRSTDTFYVSSNEQFEQSPEISHYGFRYGRATNAFDHTSSVNPSSELSSVLIDLSKSPTTRSSRAYYDDGTSSYEGTDDQLPNQHKHGHKHANRVANHAGSDVRTRRDRVPVSSNYGTQQHFRNFAPILPERTQYPLKHSKLDRDELLESTRNGHPDRNWINLERDGYLPHPSFYKGESLATSNQIPNDLYHTSNFPSPDRAAYIDQEKLRLLRRVSELQDQLKKASLSDKAANRVNWRDTQVPMYYDHEVELEESFYNSVHPRYSGSSRDGSNWSQQRKFSHIPFSAEATSSRHQRDHSLCCCPPEQKWSAQLLPSVLGHNTEFCKAHSRPNLYSSYGSCSSSPQRLVDPQFSMCSHGARSDDQKHRDDEVRQYFREKHHLPKRHLRPLAGGAPFITCPYCLKELQLPADFILFKRRCHRLKCGACLEVLKFSLVNNTHLIPYNPVAEAPPPSEVYEYSDTIPRRNFTSTSHVTDCPSVSCSDDGGQSICKSCSQGNGVERKMADGLLLHEQERKMSYLNETQSKGKTPVEYELVGASTSKSQSKVISSEIEELTEEAETGGSSPLHRLMGYSSARQVIYG